MQVDEGIFFVSADFGAPALDRIRTDFSDRFINVGIAEQNLVNVCAGLALEGMTVYAYAIATFLTMRAYEQIRNNIALMARHRNMNLNLLGVGAGLSYDMSGPSHHCLEDLSIMMTLPEISVLSPSDWITAQKLVDYSASLSGPKYWRLDGKALPGLYEDDAAIDWDKGFCELIQGGDVCLVSTGQPTHKALKAAQECSGDDIGVVDVFLLRPLNEEALYRTLSRYKSVITLEEAFKNGAGLANTVSKMILGRDSKLKLTTLGYDNSFVFDCGNREALAELNHFGQKDIIEAINENLLKCDRLREKANKG
jgi:transketolase